jgi:5-bromo-4-chloroindolyl phosphate hydrolysis protein
MRVINRFTRVGSGVCRRSQQFIRPAHRPSGKGWLLLFLPFAAVPATIVAFAKENLMGIVVNAGGYALFIFAAWLMRHGASVEAEYHNSRVSRPPKWPLKTFAAVVAALATGLIAHLGAGHSPWMAAAFALGAFLGMYLTYGFDPRTRKTVAASGAYSADEIIETIDNAKKTIARIEQANGRIRNHEFNSRIRRICEVAGSILTMLEEDPRDIRRARKFLNVYLDGARQVTEGYADTHRHVVSDVLEQNFCNVLDTIEQVFEEQKEKLLENDVFDLDVQIEVLQKQLKREGVI